MRIPFIHGVGEDGHAGDGQFKQSLVKDGAGADGAHEAVIPVCQRRGVQEGQIEGDEGSGMAAGCDAVVDLGVFGVGGGGKGVGKAHFGYWCWCIVSGMSIGIDVRFSSSYTVSAFGYHGHVSILVRSYATMPRSGRILAQEISD